MAKPIRKPQRKNEQKNRSLTVEPLPLGRQNYLILGAGILVIVAGYLAMLEGSVEGFLPLVLSPILLVTGYCVVIPLGIMYRKPAPKLTGRRIWMPASTPKLPGPAPNWKRNTSKFCGLALSSRPFSY